MKHHQAILRNWGASIILLVILLSNTGYLFFTHAEPIYGRSGLEINASRISLPFLGADTIDPNDGFVSNALGHQAASQVANGNLPLWNPYEGVGIPLLAETQSAAMSPFTLLQLLPEGWLIEHMLLQFIAGLGMYFFIKKFIVYIRRQSASTSDAEVKNSDCENVDVDKASGLKNLEILATLAGILFATIGTFVMLRNAAFNPVPFLGWHMFGVLSLFTNTSRMTLRKKVFKIPFTGVVIIASSYALAFYSGFPETVFLNSLLVATFFFVLLFRSKRWLNLLWALGGGLISALIALPWLFEFLTYLQNSDAGGHSNEGFSYAKFPDNSDTYLMHFVPNIFGYNNIGDQVTGSIGGWFMFSLLLLGLFAIISKHYQLWIKLLFGGFFIIGWLRLLGNPIITDLAKHIPGIKMIAVNRYLTPTLEFTLIVLAILGLSLLLESNSLKNHLKPTAFVLKWKPTIITIVTFTIFVFALFDASLPKIKDIIATIPHGKLWVLFWFAVAAVPYALISALFIYASKRSQGVENGEFASTSNDAKLARTKKICGAFTYLLCIILAGQSVVCFAAWPFGAYKKSTELDYPPVSFLQNNLGVQRFYSFSGNVDGNNDSIRANYGSYFNVGATNMTDMPTPKIWFKYLKEQGIETLADTYMANVEEKHIAALEDLGTRYFLVTSDVESNERPAIKKLEELGLKRVFTDAPVPDAFKSAKFNQSIAIFESQNYRHYFETIDKTSSQNTCSLEYSTREEVFADCNADTTLVRAELNYPGWHVKVDDAEVPIAAASPNNSEVQLFQAVQIPAGKHTVQFYYQPRHLNLSLILASLGLFVLIGLCMMRLSKNLQESKS